MALLPFILPFIPLFLEFDMTSYLIKASQTSHLLCISRIPDSQYSNLYQALCCGATIPQNSPVMLLFRHLGLVHLLVVSGLHLVLIEKAIVLALGWAGPVAKKSYLFLLPFVFICRFQPPVVRAFLQICVGKLNSGFHLFWGRSLLSLISGVIGVVLFPQWLISLSFQLSFGASLIASLPISNWKKAIAFYIGLSPFLATLGAAHPFSLLVNIALTLITAVPLLVISWTIWFFPPLESLLSRLTGVILSILDQVAQWIPLPLQPLRIQLNHWSWAWLLFLFGVCFTWEIVRLRRSI